MEEFLNLSLFIRTLREICEIRVRAFCKQFVNLCSFLSDGVLVYLNDVEETGGALCLAILDERELLVVAKVIEGIWLF